MKLALLAVAILAVVIIGLLIAQSAPDVPDADLVDIPGGTFVMGDLEGDPNETPRVVTVGPFRLMRFEVTNLMFASFIREGGYRTDAEVAGSGRVWDGSWRRVEETHEAIRLLSATLQQLEPVETVWLLDAPVSNVIC